MTSGLVIASAQKFGRHIVSKEKVEEKNRKFISKRGISRCLGTVRIAVAFGVSSRILKFHIFEICNKEKGHTHN